MVSYLLLAITDCAQPFAVRWMPQHHHRRRQDRLNLNVHHQEDDIGTTSSIETTITSFVYQAAERIGCSTPEESLKVEIKGDRVIVTVLGDSFLGQLLEEEVYDDIDIIDEDYSDDLLEPQDVISQGMDVTILARSVNQVFGEQALEIAETYSIEVTTPGASEELQGQVMFDAYKGFDVICDYIDKKKTKKPQQQVQGRLVERNEESTIFNLKGRMKKISNQDILSVRLPKAKKEKGMK